MRVREYDVEVDITSATGFKGLPTEIENQLKASNFNAE